MSNKKSGEVYGSTEYGEGGRALELGERLIEEQDRNLARENNSGSTENQERATNENVSQTNHSGSSVAKRELKQACRFNPPPLRASSRRSSPNSDSSDGGGRPDRDDPYMDYRFLLPTAPVKLAREIHVVGSFRRKGDEGFKLD